MRHCFSITTPGRRSIVPFAPPRFRCILTRLGSPKISSASAAAFAAAAFLLLLCRCRFLSAAAFLPLLSYQLLPFSSRFSAAFCRLPLSLLPLSYQLQPFQQPLFCCFCRLPLSLLPLSSQLLPWLFSSFGCRFLSCFSCSCFCRFSFLLQRRSSSLGFFCFDCGFGGFSAFFSSSAAAFFAASSAALASLRPSL